MESLESDGKSTSGSPYDAEYVPDVPALLLYDRAPSLQEGAADYLIHNGKENGDE